MDHGDYVAMNKEAQGNQEDYRSIAKELLQIFFKYNNVRYFKSTLRKSDLERFEELESKLKGSGVCMLCGVPKERHGTCCGERNAIQIEKIKDEM